MYTMCRRIAETYSIPSKDFYGVAAITEQNDPIAFRAPRPSKMMKSDFEFEEAGSAIALRASKIA